MDKPLVSVICLCFNHASHITEAISSVISQDYENIELIVVDDASTDTSCNVIEELSKLYGFEVIFNHTNLGNCRSFNKALARAKGKYIIDLAADDTLFPNRVTIGVERLEKLGNNYGVHFCDVELIDENGKFLRTHYKRGQGGNLIENVPEGEIFTELLERYFISAPSMMMCRNVLDELGGYDENLSYEDFDFWVRSSRNYRYAFSDQVLVRKCILAKSLSSQQQTRKNHHANSTALVCQKASNLLRDEKEKAALIKRINYEMKWALITENWEAAGLFLDIKGGLGHSSVLSVLQKAILTIKPRWFFFWKYILNLET